MKAPEKRRLSLKRGKYGPVWVNTDAKTYAALALDAEAERNQTPYYYNSEEINRAVDAVTGAREGLGIPTIEVLALVCQRFGENVHRPDAAADLAAAADELGIEL